MKSAHADLIAAEELKTREPAELFHLWNDTGTHYRYTSCDEDLTYNGDLYERATIQRGSVEFNATLGETTMAVSVAPITDPVLEYIANSPVEVFWLEITKVLRDMPTIMGTTIFIGQIKNVAFKGNLATLNCVSLESVLAMPIPKYRYQPICNNSLFDSYCGLTAASYSLSITLASVSSNGLTLTRDADFTQDDGYYTLGKVKFGNYYRFIVAHVGRILTLRFKVPDLEAGNTITIYPGCDKNRETCRDKFSNWSNFFGHPYIPLDNPATRI